MRSTEPVSVEPPRIQEISELMPQEREAICRALHKTVFQQAFPLAEEVEPPETWLRLMHDRPRPPAPEIRIHVARLGSGQGNIAGGLVIEHFRESAAALITYVATAPQFRKRGVARALFRAAIDESPAQHGAAPFATFAEIEDPDRAPPGAWAAGIDLRLRLRIFEGLRFRDTGIPYVQPSLGPGKPPVEWLRLLVLDDPPGSRCQPRWAMHTLAFLEEFHRSLGVTPGRDGHFLRMARWLRTHNLITASRQARGTE